MAPTLFGFTAEAYEAMRGFGPVKDAIERAAWWLDPANQLGGVVGETEATAALSVLEAIDVLLADEGPRGDGARFALASVGAEKLEALRARAQSLIGRAQWERTEASAVTGGLVERVEA